MRRKLRWRGALVRPLKERIWGAQRAQMGDVWLQKTVYVINKDTEVISSS